MGALKVHSDENEILKITADPDEMTHALHFLCYLNAETHSSGSASAQFHAELERALRAGMHILLVHETRGEANGAPFKTIIDATPEELKWDPKLAEKRLYKELAVMICGSSLKGGEEHLRVGLHLLLNAICAPSKYSIEDTFTDRYIEEVEASISVTHEDAVVELESPLEQSVTQDPKGTSRGWDRARSQLTRGQLELRGGMTASIAQDGSRKLFVRATLELKKHAHPGSPCGRSLHLSC